jgi:hypothetical protein
MEHDRHSTFSSYGLPVRALQANVDTCPISAGAALAAFYGVLSGLHGKGLLCTPYTYQARKHWWAIDQAQKIDGQVPFGPLFLTGPSGT